MLNRHGQVSRRDLLKWAGFATAGMTLAACAPATMSQPSGQNNSSDVLPSEELAQISYWHFWSGQHEVLVERIVELFQQDNPNIQVDVLSVPGAESLQKFLTAVAGGTPPDVQIISNFQGAVYSFAAEEAILPQDEIGDPNDVAKLKEFMSPAIWELGTYDGKLFGVPTWTQSNGLIRNKTLMAEAGLDPEVGPTTLAEFDEMAAALTKYDERGNIVQLGANIPAFWQVWPNFAGQLVAEDGRTITANHENNVRALEWAAEKAKTFDPRKVSSWQDSMQSSGTFTTIAGERLGMERTGPWRLGDIKEFNPEMEYAVGGDFVVDGVDEKATYTYGDVLVIARGSRNPQAAFTFVGYLCGLQGEDLYTELFVSSLRPHIPISETLAYSDTFQQVREGYPGYDVFLDNIFNADKIATPPKVPVAQFYIEQLQATEAKVKLGEIGPQEALDQLTADVQAELDRWHESR